MLCVTTCQSVARHCYPPGDSLLPCGQFTLCCACGDFPVCVAVMYLTLRTGFARHGSKNPLPFPISKRSHGGNLRRAIKQGKGRSPKRKGKRRFPFLFAPRRAPQRPAVRRRRIPPLRFSEKLLARQGRTRLRSSSTPVSRCRKRSCPDRANPPAQFGLGQSVQGNNSFPIDTVGIPRYTYN